MNMKYALLALPLALTVAACGDKAAKQEGEVEAATLDQPGFEGKAVTPSDARTEALALAGHLSSGDLDSAKAAVALEDLDRLINGNIAEFPEDIRPGLTEDIQSARTALEASDMNGLQAAASSIQNRLSGTTPGSNAG